MTITEFLNGNTITADAIISWTDRKGASPDHVTARCGFLRKHLAKFVKDSPIPEDTLITVARRKIGAFGTGELLVAGDKTFAAVAGAFRVLSDAEAAEPVKEEKKEETAEAPVAEAAAPAKPKRVRKAKAPKTEDLVPESEAFDAETVERALHSVFG